MTTGTGHHGSDSQNWTARKTFRTGQPDRLARAGQPGQDNQDRAARTALPGKDSRDRIARTDDQERKARS
jgi:hypothetical protein